MKKHADSVIAVKCGGIFIFANDNIEIIKLVPICRVFLTWSRSSHALMIHRDSTVVFEMKISK